LCTERIRLPDVRSNACRLLNSCRPGMARSTRFASAEHGSMNNRYCALRHQRKPGRRCRAVRRDLLAPLPLPGGFGSRAWRLFQMRRGGEGCALSCAEYERQKPCITGRGNRKAFSAFAATTLTFIKPRGNRRLKYLDVHRVVSAQRAAGTLNMRTRHGRFPISLRY
jgi:hypothetical protein